MAQFITGGLNISTKTIAYDPIITIDNQQSITYEETDVGKLYSRLFDGVDMDDILFDPRITSTTNGWYIYIINSDQNATVSIECVNPLVTINGVQSIELSPFQSVKLLTDGVNFIAQAYSTTLGDTVIGIAPTTNNALARWVGAGATVLQNSPAVLDDSGNLIGLNSMVINQINVGNLMFAANTLATTNTNGNLTLAPNGTGITTSANSIKTQTSFILEETGVGTDAITLQAPASIAASYTLTLPVDDGTAGQSLTTDGTGILSWASSSGNVVGPGSSTNTAAARFNGTNGQLLQDSLVLIDNSGNIVTPASATLKTSLILEDPGAGANTITVRAPTPLAGSYTLTLPTTDGNANEVLQTNGSGVLAWTAGGSLYNGGVNPQTGVGSYVYLTTDNTKTVTRSNAGALMTDTLPAAGVGFPSGWSLNILNLDPSASILLTVTTSQINGAGSLRIGSGQTAEIVSDNVNYWANVYGAAGTTGTTILGAAGTGGALTNGLRNTFIGAGTCPGMNSGEFNVMIGALVGLVQNNDLNTFIGYNAGAASTGTENVFCGSQSGLTIAAGDTNVCVGALAGLNTTSGNGNIFVGYDNGPDSGTPIPLANVIVIGCNSTPTANGQFVLASSTNPINTDPNVGAAGGATALPATPLGYLEVILNDVPVKIPYYNP